MLKPSTKNIVLLFFIKYFLFYAVIMWMENDYTKLDDLSFNSKHEIFLTIVEFGFLPFLFSAVFFLPLRYAFKKQKKLLLMGIIAGVLLLEYFLYRLFVMPDDAREGYVNLLMTAIFLFLLFYRAIIHIVRNDPRPGIE